MATMSKRKLKGGKKEGRGGPQSKDQVVFTTIKPEAPFSFGAETSSIILKV